MNRRTVLASAGTLAGASVAGCLSGRGESGPTFALRDVRSYRPDGRTAIVVGTVEKEGDDDGSVTIRAELVVEEDYDHAITQEFVVRAELEEAALAIPFEYDSEFLEERTYTSRAKIVRHGEADGDWVLEDDQGSTVRRTASRHER